MKIICEICSKYNIPFVLSLFFDNNLNILSGEPAIGIIKLINNYNPLAVGFNCISISLFRHFLETSEFNFPWGFYLNYGLGKFTDRKITHISEPGSELKVLSLAEEKNATFAGACCGSGPEHIKYIRNFFHGNNNT
ncbi:MAG: hypothetical protein EHM47_15225 [Ignavibacteriales bacterium]|nr:MAG: hypothetical protein EHM47_15225 [Ignavibacteriales bacterium]